MLGILKHEESLLNSIEILELAEKKLKIKEKDLDRDFFNELAKRLTEHLWKILLW